MPELWHVTAPLAAMYAQPRLDAEMINQLLTGEAFQILEPSTEETGWIRAKVIHDGYIGYIERTLCRPIETSQQAGVMRFSAPQGHLYTRPDFKSPVCAPVFFLSRLPVLTEHTNGFTSVSGSGWVYSTHLSPLSHTEPDYVETALRFLETPYLWGGRSRAGLDCSGLVQIALMAAGYACPRDTSAQINAIGVRVETAPQRGDFAFFKGHVGIMINATQMINATARHMRTVIEPLQTVTAAYDGLLQIRRL
ncbi:MAG: C40 family peptidase [Alphaproteobacteria bacterium]|nr:C40 family peptidase [Alphaproteobacteria bacterium]